MKIQFPATAGGKYLVSLTACGRIKAKQFGGASKSKVESVDLERMIRGTWLRLAASQASNGKDVHFHVDAAISSGFRKGGPPSTNDSVKALGNLFVQFANKKIEVVATGRFMVPLAKLKSDSVISVLTRIRVGHDSLAGRLAGSYYDVDAPPILRLVWTRIESDDGDDFISAEVESISEVAIDDGYLDTLVKPLHDAFRTLVLEEEPSNADD